MEALTLLPPVLALVIAVLSRNVFLALGAAILASETLIAAFHPGLGFLAGLDRVVGVFGSEGNTRIVLFCLIIGALIAYMRQSGGVSSMVTALQSAGLATTPRRAGFVTALTGVFIFVETNVSLLASGVLGRPLFDRLKVSRERLAYIIDSTCAPVSVLVLLNGWGAYAAGLLAANGVERPFSVVLATIPFNAYAWLTLAIVFATILTNRTIGPLRALEQSGRSSLASGEPGAEDVPGGKVWFMALPLILLVGGSLGFMVWTGNGDIRAGSGSASILYAVVIATLVSGAIYRFSKAGRSSASSGIGLGGVSGLIPAVLVIILALALGASLRELGTGAYVAGLAGGIDAPILVPALLFLAAALTSFTTGTSWGTYGILMPIAVPLAIGTGLPMPLVIGAVLGGGVFGDHCSPISDTTVIASLAAGCEHMDHVRTQLPYALIGGAGAIGFYLLFASLG